MTDGIGTPQDFIAYERGRLSPLFLSLTVSGAGALALSALVGALLLDFRPTASPGLDKAPAAAPAAIVAAKAPDPPRAPAAAAIVAANNPNVYGTLAAVPAALIAADPNIYGALVPLSAAPSAEPAEPEDVAATPAAPEPADPKTAENVPLPPPRPLGGGLFANHVPLRASGQMLAHEEATTTVPATASPDQRNFFEKMFSMGKSSGQSSGQVLAYAAPEDGLSVDGRRSPSAAALPYGRETAVYDIAAHTVYMPDGTKLEAHSGFGDELDDPKHVSVKMRGATPPNVYALKLREALFHGVQALRLIPVSGGDPFGRTGLLAHTYMLGPNGQSNGCVSFKNYNAFLQAYMKGEVKRLVVVAGLN